MERGSRAVASVEQLNRRASKINMCFRLQLEVVICLAARGLCFPEQAAPASGDAASRGLAPC